MKTKIVSEIDKGKVHLTTELTEYLPNAVVSRVIVCKITGNITATSFDNCEDLPNRTTPFDTYIQIIDGEAEVMISENSFQLKLGEGIVIPAHAPHRFHAAKQFKMISTVIKSGYEDLC
jgi:quercetin dioxygenase-like cupin family protein